MGEMWGEWAMGGGLDCVFSVSAADVVFVDLALQAILTLISTQPPSSNSSPTHTQETLKCHKHR